MSLIKCPKCGEEVSDKALFCVHCGIELSSYMEQPNGEKICNIADDSSCFSESNCNANNENVSYNIEVAQKEKPEMENCKNKRKKNVIKIIVIAVVLLCVVLLVFLMKPGKMRGTFDKETAQEVEVEGLTCYIPNGWSEVDDCIYVIDNGDEKGYIGVIVLEGVGTSDAREAVADNYGFEISDFLEMNVTGCDDAAYLESCDESNKVKSVMYVFTNDKATFVVDCMGAYGFYDKKEFDKIVTSFEYSTYKVVSTCQYDDSCNRDAVEGYLYCQEHLCLTPDCDKAVINDVRFCPEHALSEYEDAVGVPDFGAVSGIDNNDEEADGFKSAVSGGYMATYVYYMDKDNEYIEAYEELLEASGFKASDRDGVMDGTYENEDYSIVSLYSKCEKPEKGEMILLMMILPK